MIHKGWKPHTQIFKHLHWTSTSKIRSYHSSVSYLWAEPNLTYILLCVVQERSLTCSTLQWVHSKQLHCYATKHTWSLDMCRGNIISLHYWYYLNQNKMPQTCLIKSCTSISSTTATTDTSLTFHSIPVDLALYYLHLSGRFLDTNIQSFINRDYQSYKICSRHFKAEQFSWYIRKGKTGQGLVKGLKANVLPSLHLHACCSSNSSNKLQIGLYRETSTQTTESNNTRDLSTQTDAAWVSELKILNLKLIYIRLLWKILKINYLSARLFAHWLTALSTHRTVYLYSYGPNSQVSQKCTESAQPFLFG